MGSGVSRSGMLRPRTLVWVSTVRLLLVAGGVANAAAPGAVPIGASPASSSDDAAERATAEPEVPGRYSARPKERSRFHLGVGAGLTLGLGDVWVSRGDVIENSGTPMFLDLSVAPSYRLAPDFALGIRAGVGLEPGSRGELSSSGESVELERRLWHASALGRYQPEPGRGWYATLSVGAAALVDSRGDSSVSQWAPLIGAAAGYDLRLAPPVALGLELRAAYAEFGEGPSDALAGSYDYQVSTWLGAGVVGSLLP